MIKKPKKTDPFIVKLTKQVDDNKENIKKILDIISESESVMQTSTQLSLEEQIHDMVVDTFNIQASFSHLTTEKDKEFLAKFGNDIAHVLKAKGVKDFEMKFKK